MKRIYLIDCPGVVPPSVTDTPQDILLRGVVRVENVENPEQYIPAVLARTKERHVERTYSLKGWTTHIGFLEQLARKSGRLLHGGEPDVDGVAKMVINDFLRGKLPWFTAPPASEGESEKAIGVDGREGRLGEMGRKRKRDDTDSVADTTKHATLSDQAFTESAGDEDDEFEGFSSDEGDGDVGLNIVAEGIDAAFGLESEDEEEDDDAEDEDADEDEDENRDDDEDTDLEAEEQLQHELEDEAESSGDEGAAASAVSPPEKMERGIECGNPSCGWS